MNSNNKVIKFLQQYPVFNLNNLEKETGLSTGTLSRALSGERGLSNKATEKLSQYLKTVKFK